MKARLYAFLVLLIGISIHPMKADTGEIRGNTYGSAEISTIHRIESDFTLICNILNFPPIIGEHIPVKIRGLESIESTPNPELHTFLETFFNNRPNDPNHPLLLQNIQRGDTFCLIADISLGGEDLGDRLVQEGLVKRILKVSSAEPKTESASPEPTTTPPAQTTRTFLRPVPPVQPQSQGFIASKSSKIFHRPDCPHAKRITEDKRVYFPTRERAIAAGRRPCKACNP